ncbi:MAG: hypothetical protein AB8G23_08985 [Myxococcota bacterium]
MVRVRWVNEMSEGAEASVAQVGAPNGPAGQLWRALVALAALPAPIRRKGEKTNWVPGSSESLVVDFDEAYTSFVASFESLPEETQLLSLQAMDTHLSSMVRAQDADLWTQQAHRSDPAWVKVRDLAGDVIDAFAWPKGSETGLAGRLTLHSGEAE